ncbi:MAG: Rieske 2Fe-2S domain-containing protein [Ilumatobacteraceae bacterium]
MMKVPFTSKPTGWLTVAWSADVPTGTVTPLRYFGGHQVAFRDEMGELHVLDAHCRHLGALARPAPPRTAVGAAERVRRLPRRRQQQPRRLLPGLPGVVGLLFATPVRTAPCATGPASSTRSNRSPEQQSEGERCTTC